MKYWLMKSEPNVWSINQQKEAGKTGVTWDGVRNFQAAKNLKNMQTGDKCFFYHTGKEKSIVGVAEVIQEAFLDRSDKTKKFVSVIIRALYPLKREVTLKEIKKNKDFADFSLVKQSRLSVMNVDLKHWKKYARWVKFSYQR